jgi:hypothetical protein
VTMRLAQLPAAKTEAFGFAEPHQRLQARVAAEQCDLVAKALVAANPIDERKRRLHCHCGAFANKINVGDVITFNPAPGGFGTRQHATGEPLQPASRRTRECREDISIFLQKFAHNDPEPRKRDEAVQKRTTRKCTLRPSTQEAGQTHTRPAANGSLGRASVQLQIGQPPNRSGCTSIR